MTIKLGHIVLSLSAFLVCGCVCHEDADDFYRATNADSKAACSAVFEFLPAPGQFINENYTASSMSEACEYAKGRFDQNAYVSLGGFGGYIVVGFDHSIENTGDYDLAIRGNAFSGSSEPGIVYVMKDDNGNGLPDDTWYELAGSEYGLAETISNYSVTYYRPSETKSPVKWKDSLGEEGEIAYLKSFHRQDYYYPEWVAEDSYTLSGTRLKARNHDTSGNGTYWVNDDFDWGYADNFSKIDRLTNDDNASAGKSDNHFRISDARNADGTDANLKYIDFVKVQTGINAQSGMLGENSTEVFGIFDYHIL